jgi:hypothetical protein
MKQLVLLFLAFIALTAFIGGAMLISSPDGHTMHLSLNLLYPGPLKDYSIPGYILFFVVGGSSFFAFMSIIRHNAKAYLFSFTAGLIIITWIGIQIILIRTFYFLQAFYLALGVFILWYAKSVRRREHADQEKNK